MVGQNILEERDVGLEMKTQMEKQRSRLLIYFVFFNKHFTQTNTSCTNGGECNRKKEIKSIVKRRKRVEALCTISASVHKHAHTRGVEGESQLFKVITFHLYFVVVCLPQKYYHAN